jgi:hypothetical protein
MSYEFTHDNYRVRSGPHGYLMERPSITLPAGTTLFLINNHDGAPNEDDYGYRSKRVTWKEAKKWTVLGMWSMHWPYIGRVVEMDLTDGRNTFRAQITDNDFPPY